MCTALSREALCVCTALSREALCSTHTHHGQICCHNNDYVHVNGHDRTITVILAKHCIKLPDDGQCLSRQCSTHTHQGKYAAITPTKSMSTDTIEPLL